MVDVDFSKMDFKTKNPTARTGSVVVVEPHRITRISFNQEKQLSDIQIKRLADNLLQNERISFEVVSIAAKNVKSGLGFDQYYEAQKALARQRGVSGEILLKVKEILEAGRQSRLAV